MGSRESVMGATATVGKVRAWGGKMPQRRSAPVTEDCGTWKYGNANNVSAADLRSHMNHSAPSEDANSGADSIVFTKLQRPASATQLGNWSLNRTRRLSLDIVSSMNNSNVSEPIRRIRSSCSISAESGKAIKLDSPS